MHTAKSTINRIALSTVITLAVASTAFAGPQKNKRLSYEDAWAVCKKYVDEGVKSWDQTSQRYSRGASCMHKYGYKI